MTHDANSNNHERGGMDTIVMRPAMWWKTTNDYWNAFGIVWREEGPHAPHMELRAKDWPALVECADEFGMKLDLPEDEVKGGHGAMPYPGESEGVECWKQTRPTEFHWRQTAATWQVEAVARTWPELRDFLEEMGVEAADDPPLTLRQQGLA